MRLSLAGLTLDTGTWTTCSAAFDTIWIVHPLQKLDGMIGKIEQINLSVSDELGGLAIMNVLKAYKRSVSVFKHASAGTCG